MRSSIKLILPVIMLLLFSFVALANQEYSNIGTSDRTFETGRGFFNLNNPEITRTGVVSLTNSSKVPLADDLDGDGDVEVIVVDQSTINLYEGINLQRTSLYASTNLSGTTEMILYDIDGDSIKEIIVTSAFGRVIDIINYNGSILSFGSSIQINTTSFDQGQINLACKGTDDCFALYTQSRLAVNPNRLSGMWFDSNGNSFENEIETSTNRFCLPRIGTMTPIDYDADGQIEYVASAIGTQLKIFYLNVSSNQVSIDNTVDIGTVLGTTSCLGSPNLDKSFSSPLVTDTRIDGILDTIIAYQLDEFTYKMIVYDKNGDKTNDHPETLPSDGFIVSNIVKADVFSGTGGSNDYCVMGYDEPNNLLDLTCGTSRSGKFIETEEYKYTLEEQANLTNVFENHNGIIHSGQHISDFTDGVDLSEIITPFGIFTADLDFISGNELNLIWSSIGEEAALIPIDLELNSRVDMLVKQPDNLFYWNDGFVNLNAFAVDTSEINPCPKTVWAVNTSVHINVDVEDRDGLTGGATDLVSARAFLYEGLTIEQSTPWSANFTSGITIPISGLIANETIDSAILRIQVRDDQHLSTPVNYDHAISVSTNGISLNDCVSTFGDTKANLTDDGNVTIAVGETDPINNGLRQMLLPISQISKLGVTVLWLIIMLVVGISITTAMVITMYQNGLKDIPPFLVLIVFLVTEFLGLLIGVFANVVSGGIAFVITIVTVATILIGLWVGRNLTGTHGGMS